MHCFCRVLRLSLRYRFTLVLSVITAMGVALLWGGNIGAVYPFVEIAFRGDSLQGWVRDEIQKAQQAAADKQQEVARHGQILAAAPAQQESMLRQWIEAEQNALARDPKRSSESLRAYEALLAQDPADRQASIHSRIALDESRIAAEQEAVERFVWLKPYIDTYLPNDPFQTLALVTGLLLLGTLLKSGFMVADSILVARLAQLTTYDLRKLFYRRTLRMDLATFGDEGTSDLMSRFTYDMDSVAVGLETLYGKLIREPLKMFACLIGAALVSWRLLVLSLLIAPVAAWAIRWLGKMLKRANRRAMEEMAKIYNTLEETFSGIKIVKAFTNEAQERKRFHLRSKKYFKDAMRIARYDSLSRPLAEVMGIVAISLALLAGAWLVLSNETHLFGIRMSDRPLSLGSLLLFYAMLAGSADPIRKFSDVFTRIQRAAAAADRIYARLDREPVVRDPERPVAAPRHQKDLVFENVDFAYQPGKLVLQGLSLRIGFGQTVAVVGPNGSGKSTLANLIPRFYDPTAGEIRWDGVPLGRMRLRDLRRQIGLVTQETFLFDDTIYNNIRYGAPHATREQVIEAAKQAQAHQFIESELPGGYDTLVGATGCRLSGGQRQRIALARAILRDPALIILDEATSQIDLESEQAIQRVLERFVQNRTAIIITHRMAILTLADWIVVMESGRILDTGTHETLLGRCGLYRRLYQIQFEQPRDETESPIAA